MDTFEKLNKWQGCDAIGSQRYFNRIEVIRVDISEWSASGHIWRVFGYSPDGYYIDCCTLYDREASRLGLVEGNFYRVQP